MIINRVEIQEALKKHANRTATLELKEFSTLDCFDGHRREVTSTVHFCEFCKYYEPTCQKYLRKYKIANGREVN